MTKYLVRLDDACPEMDKEKWNRVFFILDKYDIKPLIGIIPDNQDNDTVLNTPDENFWNRMREYQKKGWEFALHGYSHCMETSDGGVNPVHLRSEFAGNPRERQEEKISRGYQILAAHGIRPRFFFAPSHTFDRTTVEVLLDKTPIRHISDTIALKPYKRYGMTFVPQQMGKFRKAPFEGYWTSCFHPNEMNEDDFSDFEAFIKENRNLFISFSECVDKNWRGLTLIDRVLCALYFTKRRLQRLKG